MSLPPPPSLLTRVTRYLLLNNSTRFFTTNSFHCLTSISILPIAVGGRPATIIQVNYSVTKLTFSLCSMLLLSLIRWVDSDEIWSISFTNICLSLVAGNVSILVFCFCFLNVSWYVANHCLFSDDFKVSRSLPQAQAQAHNENTPIKSVFLCFPRLQL